MSDGVERLATVAGEARVVRSRRKTLAISVLPDGSLELGAPSEATLEVILAKVNKRLPWIRRQQRVFLEMNAQRLPWHYASGATHRYLGRQYRLKVSLGNSPGVKLRGGFFHITAGQESEVEALLDAWMRERAGEQFSRRLEAWRGWCEKNGLPNPRMELRSMAKRWGSARKNGRIAFNPELVRAPSICIDYVMAHEICHLKHPHHGPEFYRELDRHFPQWQAVKRRLECAEL